MGHLEAGTMLLHYRLAEKIGEGGMGVVWRARDTNLDRDVAIKVLPATFAVDPDRMTRFELAGLALGLVLGALLMRNSSGGPADPSPRPPTVAGVVELPAAASIAYGVAPIG